VKLQKFAEYSKFYSNDPKTFEKKVTFASPKEGCQEFFEHVKSPFDFKNSPSENPIIIWNEFNFESSQLNENFYFFNKQGLPNSKEIKMSFKDSEFLPKSTKDRSRVKELTFPIQCTLGEESHEFKTYGKFKKSEKYFSEFSEKLTPRTKFDILAFRGEPIHIEEKINGLGFDINSKEFEFLPQTEHIIEKIHSKYSPDFYQIRLLEANGNLYFDSITTSSELSPSQSLRMYETAYEDAYSAKLPQWFKKSLFETHVVPYYQKRAYDSLLIKPKHSINFKKFLKDK
jgi:hypothetical protein